MCNEDALISFGKDVYGTWVKNARFIKENKQIEGAVREAVDLVNDIIDYVFKLLGAQKEKAFEGRSAFSAMMMHVAMPLSYGIFCNMMIGNLPACYSQMRVILEGLVKSLIADVRFPEYPFFEPKLDSLERVLSEARFSFSKMCQLLMPATVKKEDIDHITALWKDLSEKWVHARGVVKKIVDKLVEETRPPPWSIIIPVPYDKNDISDLQEFAGYVKRLRKAVEALMNAWSLLFTST
ncbi:MAG: hypothetical protein DRJ68_07035 [Thermoprotei archaeon]|nr:MAG: hypothetical protein DRJ68_07035 [Thermoprotei archaeon]